VRWIEIKRVQVGWRERKRGRKGGTMVGRERGIGRQEDRGREGRVIKRGRLEERGVLWLKRESNIEGERERGEKWNIYIYR